MCAVSLQTLVVTAVNRYFRVVRSRALYQKLFNMKISIGNHMISSAIWDKSARVNFSKTNKIARARRASAICSL